MSGLPWYHDDDDVDEDWDGDDDLIPRPRIAYDMPKLPRRGVARSSAGYRAYSPHGPELLVAR